jgi:hypothetical protein
MRIESFFAVIVCTRCFFIPPAAECGDTDGLSGLSMYLIKYHPMKFGGVEVDLHSFLTSALVGGERPASCPVRLTHLGKSPRHPHVKGDVRASDLCWVLSRMLCT